MNYNLKKLLKGQTIPELTNLIIDELSSYGVCQYIPYQDGTYHLNLTTENELTEAELNAVKNIVLNHNALNYYKKEKHKQLNEKTRSKILSEYPLEEQISSSLDIYGATHKNTMKQRIKDIIDASNVIQATIYSKQKISTLEAVDINFEV